MYDFNDYLDLDILDNIYNGYVVMNMEDLHFNGFDRQAWLESLDIE